jgi:hypothetical protein
LGELPLLEEHDSVQQRETEEGDQVHAGVVGHHRIAEHAGDHLDVARVTDVGVRAFREEGSPIALIELGDPRQDAQRQVALALHPEVARYQDQREAHRGERPVRPQVAPHEGGAKEPQPHHRRDHEDPDRPDRAAGADAAPEAHEGVDQIPPHDGGRHAHHREDGEDVAYRRQGRLR